MFQTDGELILQGGEIPLVARVAKALGYELSIHLPEGKPKRDDIAIVPVDDAGMVMNALHIAAYESPRPAGVRRRDKFWATYVMDHFLLQGHEP